nr:uncharacterized protein LOC127347887 [Lolium perenne]
MVPAWVLLKREILFEHDASAFGGKSQAAQDSMGGPSDSMRRPRSSEEGETVKVPSRQDIKDAILVYLQSVKPDAHFANPPQLSSLRLLRPTKSIPQLCEDIFSVVIASADKNLVALYAGPYRPGNNLKGGYLIYDTSKNSLSAVPQPPYDYSRADLGLGSVVLSLKEDNYLLAELTKKRGCTPPKAALSIWRPSAAEWVMYPASFPPELCLPNCVFQADMCFSYRGSVLCWVDLFKGMLICDLMLHSDGQPKFRYIPLPQQSMAYDRFEHPLRPEEFRSVACVDGSIKFVTMDGYGQRPGNELSLTAWTLSTDLCHWNKVNECFVRDIWESNNYLQSGLPKILPLFPVLSMNEDDVVYLVVTRRKVVGCQVEYMGQYLLRVDMQHHKVSFCPQNTEQIRSQPFASQCSAYVSAYHKGKVKARKVEACKDKELIWCT